MELLFLGTGNAFAMDGRRQSCYYIISGETTVLLDAGPCLLQALRENNIEPSNVQNIILSHLHPDHIGGLPYMLLDDKYITKREKPINIYGPKDTSKLLYSYIKLFYSEEELKHIENVFRFVDFEVGQTIDTGAFKITGLEANHSASPKMILLEMSGKKIGYSGDTAYHEDSFQKLLQCDVIIHEVSSYDINIPNHVNYQELYSVTPKIANPIYITHVDTSLVAAKNIITKPFILAEDNMRIEI